MIPRNGSVGAARAHLCSRNEDQHLCSWGLPGASEGGKNIWHPGFQDWQHPGRKWRWTWSQNVHGHRAYAPSSHSLPMATRGFPGPPGDRGALPAQPVPEMPAQQHKPQEEAAGPKPPGPQTHCPLEEGSHSWAASPGVQPGAPEDSRPRS